jgi:hypothetical protein
MMPSFQSDPGLMSRGATQHGTPAASRAGDERHRRGGVRELWLTNTRSRGPGSAGPPGREASGCITVAGTAGRRMSNPGTGPGSGWSLVIVGSVWAAVASGSGIERG